MDDAKNKTSLKARIQKLGTALSGMVMPNIAAIIAWGLITAIFMAEGWFPNKQIAELIGPMLNYLLPLLIGYVGGRMVYEERSLGRSRRSGSLLAHKFRCFLER